MLVMIKGVFMFEEIFKICKSFFFNYVDKLQIIFYLFFKLCS